MYEQGYSQSFISPDSASQLYQAGVAADKKGQYELAMSHLQDALEVFLEENDSTQVASSYNSMAIVSEHLRKEKQSLEYLKLALGYLPQNRDSVLWSNCLSSLGNVIIGTNLDSAQLLYEEALAIKEAVRDTQHIPTVMMNLASVGWRRGDMKMALRYDEKALTFYREQDDSLGEASTLNNLAYVYRETGEMKEARAFAEAGLTLARKIGARQIRLRCLINLSTIHSRLGDHETGFQYQREYILLKDSVMGEENQRVINEMEVRFQTEQHQKEAELKDATIAKQHTEIQLRNALVAGTILFAGLSGAVLIFFFQRRRWRMRTELESEQQEALRLKELNQFKNRFFTNITHEFRTPLTVILGLAGEGERSPGLPSPPNTWNLIRRNGSHLLRLINQLLDLSKLETGKLPIQWVQVNAVDYVRYLTESFRSLADSREITLTLDLPEEPILTDLDLEKTQDIIANLLGNALKFTPTGGQVMVTVSGGQTHWTCAISDTGPGIAPEYQEQIFDRFAQLNPEQHGGTGIGLALTRELVDLLNGHISLESEEGAGSTFSILLPIHQTAQLTKLPELPIRPAIPAQLSTVRQAVETDGDIPHLLIIEDNADIVDYLQNSFEGTYQISVAPDGQKGVEMALQHIPDAIISDVMMPHKDGFTVCQELKQDERTSHIPIILLTARAAIEDKLQGLKYGADAYLPKPFEREELLIRLEQLILLRRRLQVRYQQTGQLPSTEDKSQQAEDSFIRKVREEVLAHLSDQGFTVERLAEAIHLSRTQLFRKIKALTGRSVSQLINQIRVEQAEILLLQTDQTVSEIAYQTGFSDPNYFMRVFSRERGMSAGEWRKKQK